MKIRQTVKTYKTPRNRIQKLHEYRFAKINPTAPNKDKTPTEYFKKTKER